MRWEYTYKAIAKGKQPFLDALNVLGQDGWELIHFENSPSHVYAVLKRPAQTPDGDEIPF